MPSADADRAPMPRKPLALTRLIPLRSHCRPNTSSSEPTTSRRAPIGTSVSAVPSAPTSTARMLRPAAAPSQVERHPRTLPTPTTMITISMTSTAAARNVVTNTDEGLIGDPLRAEVAECQSGGADVLTSVPGRHGGMPLDRERAQQRRDIAGRGADGEIDVFERPLERELGGEVALVHLVELGV